MLGYASGVILHDVGGSGTGFRPIVEDGKLVLNHECPAHAEGRGLLSLPCVRISQFQR